MHERYSLPEMSQYFTTEAQWAAALLVEIAAVRARVTLGQVSPEDLAIIEERSPIINKRIVGLIRRREATTDHDVAAFVDVVQRRIKHAAASQIHYGLTSADVTDTALCYRLVRATDLLLGEAEKLLVALCERAREFAMMPTAGRTHGQHAEIITFGVRLANWAFMVERAIKTLELARAEIAVGKLSGACGTYTNIDPEVEKLVCAELGLRPIVATQVIPRDLHANLVYACTRLGNAIGEISFNLRIMAATEFGEVEEGRRPGQKGSSAMPHKRNPIKTEQFSGLARNFRGYLSTSLENVELLFERDISHSAPERIVLPDVFNLIYYMVVTTEKVLRRLVVKPERMQANIDSSFGLMFTQTVLTEMLDAGWKREKAYNVIQSLASEALEQKRPLRELLTESDKVDFSDQMLEHMFDQDFMLLHVDRIIAQLPR